MPLLTEKDVLRRLQDSQSIQESPLLRGAEIGSIDFSRHVFKHPFDFSGALFKDHAVFKAAQFTDVADFPGVEFQQGANF